MNWKEKCIGELTKSGLFENSGHRTRFKELLDCFYDKPFFTKGLCKCMYLSAWDEEHFIILLTTLTQMSLGNDEDTNEMLVIGDSMADEETTDESLIYRLSISYLDNSEFYVDENIPLSPRTAYVIKRAQHAAMIIDEVH
ncbi:MAG: hypothetical protein Q4F83_14680 [Eubacteriales bacterium]|nr:hypothetical protein [Eubacteriales bacterium]